MKNYILEIIKRSDKTEIRIQRCKSEDKDYELIDIRIFFDVNGIGDYKPTKKGLTMLPNNWETFKHAVNNVTIFDRLTEK